MHTRPDILIVEDDPSVRDALAEYLVRHGYHVRSAVDAVDMDRLLNAARPDLIVMDIMLPGEDGLAACRRLAAGGPPILMLSALGETTDRIVGLELGAADYLAKPFEPRELLARVRAVLRRGNNAGGGSTSDRDRAGSAILEFAGWRLEVDERRLRDPEGALMTLSPGEIDLLRAFVERPGRLLSRQQLMDLTHGENADTFDRAIDLSVSRLRRKLAGVCDGGPIETVRGGGYRFKLSVRRA